MSDKIPKAVAVYLPRAYTGRDGTKCATCRDFIASTSMCVITDDPKVSAQHGTCTQYINGKGMPGLVPLRLVPKKVVGYIEGDDVPTYCGRCEYYADPLARTSECSKVGDSPEDVVDYFGCCNGYQAR